jgi:hypothetical protein
MKKNLLKKSVFFADISSIVLVIFSAGLIIYGAINFIVPRGNNEIILKITPPNIIDSIQVRKEIDAKISTIINKNSSDTSKIKKSLSFEIKFNSKDVTDLQKENQIFYKKIDTLLVQFQKKQELILKEREDRESYISFTTALMSVIIALAGFFGFKSINDMKLKAIEIAEKEANTFLITKESEIEKLYSDKISKAVDKKINTVKMLDDDNVKSIIKNEIDALKSEIEILNLKINKCCIEKKRKNKDTTATELNNEVTIEEGTLTENNDDIDDLYDNVDLTK